MTKIFLTGITGLVGSAFAVALLRERGDMSLVCLVRPGGGQSAEDRVGSIIREQAEFDGCPEAAEMVLKRISVVPGDVTDMDAAALAADPRLAGVEVIFHCAADVNLGKDPTGRTFHINYGGTQNMLALAQKLRVKAFHYVSTAYTAGRNTGVAYETAHPDAGFNNPYEESKYKAEMLVRASGIPFTIYRPAIITGRRSDGRIRRPLAFYRIVEFIGKIKKHRCAKMKLNPLDMIDLDLHFYATPADRVFFVPIDFVCEAITALFQKPVENKTYHVTGDSPVSTLAIKDAVCAVLRVANIQITAAGSAINMDEKLMSRYLGDLLPYFSNDIIFDQSNIRAALGDKALDWKADGDSLCAMIEAYFIDFFADVDWIRQLVAENRAERAARRGVSA